MSKKRPEELKQYKRDLIQALLIETYKIMALQSKEYGGEFAADCIQDYLGSFVATAVFNNLKRPVSPGIDGELQHELVHARHKELKSLIEEAVAQGFASGFTMFQPTMHPEYQCDIVCVDPGFSDGKTN